MSKLNIDQKTINDLFASKKSDFLIPDYQRPYAWTEDECNTLWDDIFTFAFPNDDCDAFDSANDEYFLGPIVTFKNADGKLEIIDGQQRLTTIMLLLRAFYSKFEFMKDKQSVSTRDTIARCIWKTDEFGDPDKDRLKIDSEVASDDDKEEFLEILKSGRTGAGHQSKYAATFSFFEDKIARLVNEYPSYTAYLATRILNNVILLPIEAESQDSALRIFSTLNDRGLPLSDADIFKSQFYKQFSDAGRKNEFISRWKVLEEKCAAIFKPMRGTPMDELFTRYMYFERARQGNRNTTTEALRDFYEKNAYELLKRDETFDNLEQRAGFWERVDKQDGFSERVLKRLFVLGYAPNGMWTYLVSVYFMSNKDDQGELDEGEFFSFLSLITAFIWAYAIERPGVNALRTPVYPEMINIVNGEAVSFANHRFEAGAIRDRFMSYVFTNGRPVTKSMLTWWAFNNDAQPLLDADARLEIEHIYSKKRADAEGALKDRANLESLGNKSLLEKRINIRASDYRFEDKKKYYLGYVDGRKQEKEGTRIKELADMAGNSDDFTEADIVERKREIVDSFVDFLGANGLLA